MKKQIIIILFSLIGINIHSQSWSIVGNGHNLSGLAANVWTLFPDTNASQLIVGGCFDSIDNAPAHHIGEWNSTMYSGLGTGMDAGVNYGVFASAMYNGELYVGGDFFNADGIPTSRIARWNGSAWDSVQSGVNNWVYCMKVFNGELYVGGAFNRAGGIPVDSIAKWDGQNWYPVGTNQINGRVCGIEIYNNQLYISTGSNCYFLNSNTWMDMGVQGNFYNNPINGFGCRGMAVYNGELYVGGLTNAGGNPVNSIARWNGSVWSDVGGGLTYNSCNHCAAVGAMAIYNGALFVGGEFATAGSVSVNNIAKWDGQNWTALESGTNNIVLAMSVFNNSLYVGGSFTTAGGLSSDFIAKWQEVTQVEETNLSFAINIFPNSSKGLFQLKGNFPSDSEIHFYNLLGEEATESISVPKGDQTIPVYLNLPAGIYFCRIISGTQIIGEQKLSIVK